MKPWVLILIGAALVLAAVAGIRWYGHDQYAAGHQQAALEAQAEAQKLSEQYRAQEAAAQQSVEANYAKYRGQILASQAHAADLDAAASGLRAQLDKLRSGRAAANSQPAGRVDAGAAPDFIGVIAACAGRYDEVVRYAGQLADQLTGLQGYVRAISSPLAP
ncbi:hypothetical protein CEY04_27965 [Achromobacter sp. HZ28]|nr:hypothetical protein CEY05_29135 [Achromobacter sp. HZ34]OWT69937.1 hypothetical protein CEY04_27965 [Achromobacter sp. HZ28]